MKDYSALMAVLIYIVIVCAGLAGWIMNLIKIFSEHDQIWFIGRIVGAFLPLLGAVLGYL